MPFQRRFPNIADKIHIGRIFEGDDTAVIGFGSLYAQNEIHTLHIGHHLLRKGHITQIGHTQAGFAFTDCVKYSLHHHIFEEQRHQLDHHHPFAANVGGDAHTHSLGCHFDALAVIDHLTDLGKFIVPQLG